MKKIVLLCSMLCIALLSHAQVSLKFGVKAGLNVSDYTADAASITQSLTGVHAGVLVRLKVLGMLAIQPELLYSTQGAKYDFSIGSIAMQGKEKTSYLAIPIMVKFYPLMGLNLQAGPQLGFLLSAKTNGEDVKDTYKSTALSFQLGAGYDFDFGLGIDARYGIGLTNIADAGGAVMKNNVFSVGASYCF